MTANLTRLRATIQNFRFEDLFIEELGWDLYHDRLEVVVDGDTVTLNAFAQKRGMVAFIVAAIPEYKLRRKIEQQVAKAHRENIIIYADQTQQIWQWVRRETGKPLANRERQFTRGQSGENIAQILSAIAFSLDEEDDLTIVDVTSRVRAAFDVERVTRRFYDRFKRQHDAFLAFIEGIPDEDFRRWYASVMLNRIMFIYFVQRKGFLDGDTDYLRNRLAQVAALPPRSSGRGAEDEGSNFYRDFLIPLFFKGFATRNHPPEVRRLLGDVPYLNGGLFLPHQIEELYGDAIQIENEAFEKLFDFFDEYHWHLDERPLRDDNEINPDVLGYIFEKYINQKQMGAYYTKEDITEYISKNTVIPFLFDEARKAVKIAFEGDHTVWDLLAENPDRYIYPAVRHGAELPLPQNIAAGLDDVSQRGDWNTPAPPEYGLPTEIWRETVARRQRYKDICGKLEHGEVRQINDLITLNLDIQQFAQDVIDFTDSPDVIRAFWKAINRVTVLDPTCGSGAFLFAALNILEPLYEACLERMEAFLAELDRTTLTPDPSPSGRGEKTHPQKYSDFREVMARIDQHPNRRYFILKSIIIQNLYGVDIMEEAVEIAKLRLFLKLVAQVDDKRRIEPLPDIDFNIRAGNTLVGFATQDEVRRAMTTNSAGQGKLLFGEDQAALDEIERKAADIDRLFGLFRQQQTDLGGEVRPEDKAELKRRLGELEDELNRLLAGQYGIDPAKAPQYAQWQKSHEPFHWFVEFYGVLKNGGFDVIIGNPPYVEYSKVRKEYQLPNDVYSTERCGNLYAPVIEASYKILRNFGYFGMIIPLASICTKRMEPLQNLLLSKSTNLVISNYEATTHPTVLFIGAQIQLSIVLARSGTSKIKQISITDYIRSYAAARPYLFQSIRYCPLPKSENPISKLPKVGEAIEESILQKIFGQKTKLGDYISRDKTRNSFWYRNFGNFYFKLAFLEEPKFLVDGKQKTSSTISEIYLTDDLPSTIVVSVIGSTLFYWYWVVFSDLYHTTKTDLAQFPLNIQSMDAEIKQLLTNLCSALIEANYATAKWCTYNKKSGITQFWQFWPQRSKHIIDEIDRVLARHYGFTDEELDFIINYDIKYRMGDDLGGDEGE